MNCRLAKYGALFTVYASLSAPALAYLDGATASILLQALIGAVATWLVYSRMLVSRAKTFIAKLFGRTDGVTRAE